MTTATYPFDTTGTASTNLVKGELHTLTEVNAAPYRVLIPTAAPFYLPNLKLEYIDQTGVARDLIEGVDYYNTLIYMAASRSTGRPCYGGWEIINSLLNGTIHPQYQTVGGDWVADRDYVYQQLLEKAKNPRIVYWDDITNVQQLFPPTEHSQPADSFEGHQALLASLEGIRQAILEAPTNVPGEFMAHINAKGNVHGLTKTDLGLQDLTVLPLSTDQEVLALADVDKYFTLAQLGKLLKARGVI